MTRWPIFVLAILVSDAWNASAQDHLEPERGSVHETEAGLRSELALHQALLKDAASQYRARVFCEPFGPKWVVTLACDEGDRPTYFVEYAGFEERKEGGYRVRKERASLDREAAEAVQEVWLRMLREARFPDVPRTGADGVIKHVMPPNTWNCAFGSDNGESDDDAITAGGRHPGGVNSAFCDGSVHFCQELRQSEHVVGAQ